MRLPGAAIAARRIWYGLAGQAYRLDAEAAPAAFAGVQGTGLSGVTPAGHGALAACALAPPVAAGLDKPQRCCCALALARKQSASSTGSCGNGALPAMRRKTIHRGRAGAAQRIHTGQSSAVDMARGATRAARHQCWADQRTRLLPFSRER